MPHFVKLTINYHENNLVFIIIIFFSTSWKKQPYTKGSYTAIAVGASQSDIESLAQPLFRNINDKKVTILFYCLAL